MFIHACSIKKRKVQCRLKKIYLIGHNRLRPVNAWHHAPPFWIHLGMRLWVSAGIPLRISWEQNFTSCSYRERTWAWGCNHSDAFELTLFELTVKLVPELSLLWADLWSRLIQNLRFRVYPANPMASQCDNTISIGKLNWMLYWIYRREYSKRKLLKGGQTFTY